MLLPSTSAAFNETVERSLHVLHQCRATHKKESLRISAGRLVTIICAGEVVTDSPAVFFEVIKSHSLSITYSKQSAFASLKHMVVISLTTTPKPMTFTSSHAVCLLYE